MFKFIQFTRFATTHELNNMHHLRRILQHFPKSNTKSPFKLQYLKNVHAHTSGMLLASIIKRNVLPLKLYAKFRTKWMKVHAQQRTDIFEIAVAYGNLEWINYLRKQWPKILASIERVVIYKVREIVKHKMCDCVGISNCMHGISKIILPKFATKFTTKTGKETYGFTLAYIPHTPQFPTTLENEKDTIAYARVLEQVCPQFTVISAKILKFYDMYTVTNILIKENLGGSLVKDVVEKLGTLFIFHKNAKRVGCSRARYIILN